MGRAKPATLIAVGGLEAAKCSLLSRSGWHGHGGDACERASGANGLAQHCRCQHKLHQIGATSAPMAWQALECSGGARQGGGDGERRRRRAERVGGGAPLQERGVDEWERRCLQLQTWLHGGWQVRRSNSLPHPGHCYEQHLAPGPGLLAQCGSSERSPTGGVIPRAAAWRKTRQGRSRT